jgi:hypothetical protein
MIPKAVELFYLIERDGYCVLKGAISPEIIESITQQAINIFNSDCQNLPQRNRNNKFTVYKEFLQIVDFPIVNDMCKLILGNEYRIDHVFTTQGKVKCTSDDILDLDDIHGGPFSNGGSNFYNHGMPGVPVPRAGRFNIGIPLTISNKDVGGPQILPGTHIDVDLNTYIDNPKKNGTGGVSIEWINTWLNSGNEIVIPELVPGDILLFVDALLHGTSRQRTERMICYGMATPGFIQLIDYKFSAKKYFDISWTDNQKARFTDPWYFKIFPEKKRGNKQRNRKLYLNSKYTDIFDE